MTNFDFYNDEEYGAYEVPQEATSDTTKLVVRRGIADFSKQAVDNAEIANVVRVYAGEIVHDVLTRTITTTTVHAAEFDIGFNGGKTVADSFNGTAANAFNANVTFVPVLLSADNAITLTPNNALEVNAGKVEVMAVISQSLFA